MPWWEVRGGRTHDQEPEALSSSLKFNTNKLYVKDQVILIYLAIELGENLQ